MKSPIIAELYLELFRLFSNDIIVFLDQIKSLKQFKCDLSNPSECDRLMKQLANEWHHKIVDTLTIIIELKR